MITIYDWFGYSLPINERYHCIKQAGFDGVLLWWSDGFGRGDYLAGPKLAEKAGLFIENIHAPIQNQNDLWLDNLKGEALTNCYLQCIKDCSDFRIPTMVVHLPDDDYPCNVLGIDRIKKMEERARLLKVNVAFENLRNYNNLTTVLDQVTSPNIGFCYDCCHHYNYCGSYDLLSMYGSRLMAVHLHDNGGSRLQHQLPFDGNINWNAVMQKLAQVQYQGATALEPMNWDYSQLTVEQFLHTAFEKAKKLEALRRP